jgi:hypothetical protein
VVTISAAQTPEVYDTDDKGNHTLKFPAKALVDAKKYGDPAKSGLEATIAPGKNELTFTVERLP